VKIRHKKRPLRFGDWIAHVDDGNGGRKEPRIVQFAVHRYAVTFREQQRFVIR